MLSVVALFAAVEVVSGHLCVWDPPQRSGAGEISTPGEHVCYLKEGPCGGVPSGEPMVNLKGGSQYTIHFQQNLNHFYKEDPGSLVADFAVGPDPSEDDFSPLGDPIPDYNAMNEITQTNFTVTVNVPNMDCEHCVVRMRYLSNNPTENDRGMIFYQCSDVAVTKQDTAAPAFSSNLVRQRENEDHSCCAADQFTLEGYETSSWRNPTQKKYYFDAKNQLFRQDTYSGSGTTTRDGAFQMYSNFSSGIEYYYNVNADTCDLYGLNYWSDWCYGKENSQEYVTEIVMGSETADVWTMRGSDFTWTNQRTQCIPVGSNRASTGETTVFYNYKTGTPRASAFELPEACTEAARKVDRVALKPSPRQANHF